ncbi:cob(I)yrinic acid a,c-diamide adenosyltransferase [Clostridium sp. 19966]|uniref:cob(I)yrinic acid a,c-diamide adenosyltransferase n=1 Tax=Clostridium sp. 19966 TaxID=2768166 RepID=UPI0028DD648E|nr:cob(I)yrinic acid a,c-diamide adenosyltransferase [Clostridium sp. 19966]MDT8718948.1 cob(I)yrinic acid a,c-diamide adenosyltransferase [Clostridium sp. 19966]
MEKGYVQIYTGNGKGKTTAALGLGLRAAGNKFKVYMIQFLKTSPTGELESIKNLEPYFKVFRFESSKNFFWNLNDEEKKLLKKEVDQAYDFIMDTIKTEACDVLILDEILGALANKLIEEREIIDIIDKKPKSMELILTGRNAPEGLIERADLVTEMKDVKHYMNEGIAARKGIEY